MVLSIRTITILGAGQIGRAVAGLLAATGDFEIRLVDQRPLPAEAIGRTPVAFEAADLNDDRQLAGALAGADAVINALPFHMAARAAAFAISARCHYFDLTEDVAATRTIRSLAAGAGTVLMPQCGLAPGFIGVVGNELAQHFEELRELHLRVGALPRYPSNALKYNLTWSTEGLINEYCNPCDAMVDGRLVQVPALEGLESFSLDGTEYEAFNTSGGLGTLPESLAGGARAIDYKSIRYPGHCATMKLLLNDLRLRDRRDLLRDVLENAVPATRQDVVVVFATASGMQNGRLVQESFSARIHGSEASDGLTAIQLTTASGLCAALDLVRAGKLPARGFVRQEQIALRELLANRFGRRLVDDRAGDRARAAAGVSQSTYETASPANELRERPHLSVQPPAGLCLAAN